GHAGPRDPQLTDHIRFARATRRGLDDEDLRPENGASTRGKDPGARTRFGRLDHAPTLQLVAQYDEGGTHAPTAHDHRTLREPIAGKKRLFTKPIRRKYATEAFDGLVLDGLGAVERDPPRAQVQALALLRLSLPRAEIICEVRCGSARRAKRAHLAKP